MQQPRQFFLPHLVYTSTQLIIVIISLTPKPLYYDTARHAMRMRAYTVASKDAGVEKSTVGPCALSMYSTTMTQLKLSNIQLPELAGGSNPRRELCMCAPCHWRPLRLEWGHFCPIEYSGSPDMLNDLMPVNRRHNSKCRDDHKTRSEAA